MTLTVYEFHGLLQKMRECNTHQLNMLRKEIYLLCPRDTSIGDYIQ